MTKVFIINAFAIIGRIVVCDTFTTMGNGTEGLFIACES